VARALDALSPNERAAFVLRHVEGLSTEEIAAALNLRTNATKQTVFRAVHKLTPSGTAPGGRAMTHGNDDELDKRTIEFVRSALEAPSRGEDYGREVWNRLQPKLETHRGDRRPPVFGGARLAPWAWAAAVLILVAGAFFAGRATQRPQEAALSAEARRRVLLAAVGDHLERSRMVLLEFVNAAPVQAVGAWRRGRELVASNRLYRRRRRQGEPRWPTCQKL
jgi:hypothetical protein